MRVLITEPIETAGIDLLRDFETDQLNKVSPEEVARAAREADAIIVKYASINRELLLQAPRILVVAKHGVGVNTIDVSSATDLGVLVLNAPSGNTISVIEYTWGMIFALTRNIVQAANYVSAGSWNIKDLWGTELSSKTLGIIGLGTIGSGVAKIGQCFDMRVIAFDHYRKSPPDHQEYIELVSMEQLLVQSDILVSNAPLTPETYHMIGSREIAQMPKGSYIVNTSRGGIIDELALIQALDSGHIAGAGLDVFEDEPLKKENPLVVHPKVVSTPHLASGTKDAQRKVALEICADVARVLNNERPIHPVNKFEDAYRLHTFFSTSSDSSFGG